MSGVGGALQTFERVLVEGLALERLPLDPMLAHAQGSWRGEPVRIDTRAYHGDRVVFARFAFVEGAGLSIGNALALGESALALPILGADLVDLGHGRETMVAVDLSPTLDVEDSWREQLVPLARRRREHASLPTGGELPSWCSRWFSPLALFTRVGEAEAPAAFAQTMDFARAYVEIAREAEPHDDSASLTRDTMDAYLSAHREFDRGLGLLARIFGSDWAAQYLHFVLLPSMLDIQGHHA